MRRILMTIVVISSLAFSLSAVVAAQDSSPRLDVEESAPQPWPSTALRGAHAITAAHDRFVVVGEGGKRRPFAKVWTSTDGLDWTRAPDQRALEGAGMHAVASTVDGFVALGADARNRVTAWYSPDGLAWMRAVVKRPSLDGWSGYVQELVAGPNGLLAYANFSGQDFVGNRIWRSKDGRTWRPVQLPRKSAWPFGGLVAIPGGFLLIDGDKPAYWLSDDGREWTAVDEKPVQGWLRDAAISDGGTVVAIGVLHQEPYPLAAWASTDLESWQLTWQSPNPESAADEEELSWLTWDGSRFAATGVLYEECGKEWKCQVLPLLLSDDGYTWVESDGPDGLPGYEEGLWVNDIASLDDLAVVLGGIGEGPSVAWLMGGTAVRQDTSSVGTAASGQRIVSAEAGIGVAFPEDWTATVRMSRDGAWTELFGPGVYERHGLSAMGPDKAGDARGFCSVRAFRPTSLPAADYVEQGFAALGVASPTYESVGVGLLRIAGPSPELGGDEDVYQAVYVLDVGDALAVMDCQAADPPDDVWLPIAETLKILPITDTDRGPGLTEEVQPTPLEVG